MRYYLTQQFLLLVAINTNFVLFYDGLEGGFYGMLKKRLIVFAKISPELLLP
jgi:hypothetical protein